MGYSCLTLSVVAIGPKWLKQSRTAILNTTVSSLKQPTLHFLHSMLNTAKIFYFLGLKMAEQILVPGKRKWFSVIAPPTD